MAILKNQEIHFVRLNPNRPEKNMFDPTKFSWSIQCRSTDKAQIAEWKALGLKPKVVREDKDDEESKEWTSKITELRILTVPSSVMENNIPLRVSLKRDMDGIISKFAFERMLRVKDKTEEVEMYVSKTSNGALIFLNSSDAEYTVIAMFGKIDDMLIKAAASGKINIK